MGGKEDGPDRLEIKPIAEPWPYGRRRTGADGKGITMLAGLNSGMFESPAT